MRKLALLVLLMYLLTFTSLAKDEYYFLNLKGEISQDSDKLIIISWNNTDTFNNDIKEGKITDAYVEFDIRLDQGKYLSERNLETFNVDAKECKATLNPFAGKQELNTENTLVSIRMRYVFKKAGKIINTDFIEPIVLGHDSFIKNASYWSKSEFNTANKLGILLSSYKSDVSRPINRYEFIKTLMRLNKFIGKTEVESNLKFDDEDDKDINLALKLGIVKGINGNLFSGEKNLTKQEMVTVLTRYIKLLELNVDKNSNYQVKDFDKVSSWAKPSVKEALELGIIKGDETKSIHPLRDVTCEEAVVMIIRILELKK